MSRGEHLNTTNVHPDTIVNNTRFHWLSHNLRSRTYSPLGLSQDGCSEGWNQDSAVRFAKLRRERPANNPIGNRHLEMNVALDA